MLYRTYTTSCSARPKKISFSCVWGFRKKMSTHKTHCMPRVRAYANVRGTDAAYACLCAHVPMCLRAYVNMCICAYVPICAHIPHMRACAHACMRMCGICQTCTQGNHIPTPRTTCFIYNHVIQGIFITLGRTHWRKTSLACWGIRAPHAAQSHVCVRKHAYTTYATYTKCRIA